MKKETLARAIVVMLVLIAVAIPLIGRRIPSSQQVDAVELHARMPENGGWSLETIKAQVDQPIKLHITSDDVVHGFAIGKSDRPALNILPGEYVDTTLTFDKPGKYTFYCTRWCGANHWRMRGTIEVTGPGEPLAQDPQPLFLKLGIDIDAPMPAENVPAETALSEKGAQFVDLLPAYALDRETYLTSSPAELWQRLRGESSLSGLSDQDVWDVVALIWEQQTTSQALAVGQELYAANCAACHGGTGKGDGVMVEGLPVWDPSIHAEAESDHQSMGEGLFSPPDFTDPKNLLGASPALLEGKIIRGGMGTGMPYWGSIFTPGQINALVDWIYTFAW